MLALLKDPGDLDDDPLGVLHQLRRERSVLYRCWQLKEGLRDLYRLRHPQDAPSHLRWLLAWACRSRIPAFVRLSRTIRAKRELDPGGDRTRNLRGYAKMRTSSYARPSPPPIPTANPVLGTALVEMLIARDVDFHPGPTIERIDPEGTPGSPSISDYTTFCLPRHAVGTSNLGDRSTWGSPKRCVTTFGQRKSALRRRRTWEEQEVGGVEGHPSKGRDAFTWNGGEVVATVWRDVSTHHSEG